eukprot:CAMPEP_0184499302 /NCGR_PEP_ID=MMETSP0113_2-20130426/41146_1 /TAXON_ID=91329 /ORGANISM="Norrisiella sphaerica, Strain BC52" /LENGTH=926 /DNA_ID=CAMNT_0026887159 /DNA_START=1 /DNA_END=2781 /DNA_ORIENTATION=+
MIETDPVYLKVFADVLGKHGHKVDKKFFEQHIHGKVDQEIFSSLMPSGTSQAGVDKAILEKDKLFRQYIFNPEMNLLKTIGGLIEFMNWAESHRIRFACVTNCPRDTAEALLSALDLRRRMDFLVVGAECDRAKPHPDPYQVAMSRLGARPDECVVFEDSRSGIQSAVASKARLVIGIRSSLSDHVLLQHGANVTVKDFTEITPELFNQLHSSLLSPRVEERVISALRENGFPVRAISSARQLPGGNVAQCLRMTVLYKTDTDEIPYPKSMILKIEYPEAADTMVECLHLYEREWSFYKSLSRFVTVRVPSVYATINDSKGRTFGVVMEDLAELEGAQSKQSLDIEEAKSVVTSLAKMHARFWNQTPQGVLKANDSLLRDFVSELTCKWGVFKEKWQHRLLDEQISYGEIIMHHLNWIQDQVSQKPSTLCHGDLSKDNIFFVNLLREEPALIDWQYCSIGKGVSDVAHFLLASFPLNVQAQMEHQLVECYHRALRLNGIYGYSFKQCWHDYRMSLMLIPFISAVWYGSLNRSELVDPEYPVHLTAATFSAIRRHNAVQLLPEYFSMSLTHRCKKALKEAGFPVENVIIDAKKLKGGYICETLRLTMEYSASVDTEKEPDKYPTSCVLKAEAPNSSDHQTALNLHLYDREWHFYQTMSKLVPVRCPKYYASIEHADGKGRTMGILMEDLCIPGAVLCPKLDYSGVQNLVKNSAKMHAKFWNDPKLDSLGVHRLNGPWFQPSWEKKIAGHWPDFKSKWASVLSTRSLMDGEKIVNNFRFIQNHLSSPPFTFLHGDVKPANMFMLKGNIPAFIDWQYTKIGKGVCDIVFFLIEGYPESVQRELEGKVRTYYHECLVEFGVKDYTMEMCERDWAIACMYFPIYVAMWFGTVPDELLVDVMFPRRFVPRAFDAIERNNATSYLPKKNQEHK